MQGSAAGQFHHRALLTLLSFTFCFAIATKAEQIGDFHIANVFRLLFNAVDLLIGLCRQVRSQRLLGFAQCALFGFLYFAVEGAF
ncbi:hypothetical protein D3C87_2052170 [compost metagenome]